MTTTFRPPFATHRQEEVEASILRYTDVLRNYECSRILNLETDVMSLDLAKIEIANAVLRSRGFISSLDESQIKAVAAELARKGEAPGEPRPNIPAWLRWKVYRRDKYRCVDCGKHWDLSCDHIIPVSKGGPTTEQNLLTRCRPCNSKKGAS